MLADGLLDFCLIFFYGRAMVIDPSAEVACFINVSLRATFATNEIDAVICAARPVANYLVCATSD